MITALLFVITLVFTLLIWFFLFPVRLLRNPSVSLEILEPPDVYVYSFVLHIHTQFSHDSLGKPEDIERALDLCGINFAIVTDHENDLVGRFSSDRILAGREVKVREGDLLEFGDLKVIAHPFSEKYTWKGRKDSGYLLEIVDLKDEVLRYKVKLFLFLLTALLLYPFLRRRVLKHLVKVLEVEKVALRYLREGWNCPVVGGLDHHVKVYITDASKRILIPDYTHSFSLMRNLVMTPCEVKSARDLPKAIKEGRILVSFSEKAPLVWREGRNIKVYSPYANTLTVLLSERGVEAEVLGPNSVLESRGGRYMVVGYTYILKLWNILFGLRPLFLALPAEERDEGKTPS
ncbi:MAG: hypothetical protein Q9N34_09930 [Aquificota bacterium]|nr:hypothetical protein [Aquificota bacterium]